MQLTLEADRAWTPVEPGTDVAAVLRPDGSAETPWRAVLAAHARYAVGVADDTGSTARLLADEQTGLAAAVGLLAIDGPAAFEREDEAVDLAARFATTTGTAPLVGAATLGPLAGVVVTFTSPVPEWLASHVDDPEARMSQSVVVAPDGLGTVLVAVSSPQPSTTAGPVLAAVGALLRTVEVDA